MRLCETWSSAETLEGRRCGEAVVFPEQGGPAIWLRQPSLVSPSSWQRRDLSPELTASWQGSCSPPTAQTSQPVSRSPAHFLWGPSPVVIQHRLPTSFQGALRTHTDSSPPASLQASLTVPPGALGCPVSWLLVFALLWPPPRAPWTGLTVSKPRLLCPFLPGLIAVSLMLSVLTPHLRLHVLLHTGAGSSSRPAPHQPGGQVTDSVWRMVV